MYLEVTSAKHNNRILSPDLLAGSYHGHILLNSLGPEGSLKILN